MRVAILISIQVEASDTGLLFARSPELPGLNVASANLEGLELTIPAVIEALLAEQGKPVEVFRVESHCAEKLSPWVIIPKDNHQSENQAR